MVNLKNITELPVVESAEGLNLIVNDNGSAKQIAASAVGAQADWNVTDESSPAFIKNKPVEELDLDIEIVGTYTGDDGNGDMSFTYTVNTINTFENIKSKILSGVQPKCKAKISTTGYGNTSGLRYTESFSSMHAVHFPGNEEFPELIRFNSYGASTSPFIVLLSDNTIVEVGDDY
jgi:hypothetical protein